MSMGDWQLARYNEVFEQVRTETTHRLRHEGGFTVDHVRGLLETCYVSEGNDWAGRGPLFHLVQSATIAAYEAVLSEWHGKG